MVLVAGKDYCQTIVPIELDLGEYYIFTGQIRKDLAGKYGVVV